MHGVSENFPLLCGRVFGRATPDSLSKASANCDMRFGCDILLTSIRDSGVPLFLSAMEPLWLQPDLATHQVVVCVAIRTVVRACV